jgi:hypothetical protein
MNYRDKCQAAEEEGYEAGLSGRPKSEFADKFEGDLGFYFLRGYCLGVVEWGMREVEADNKKREREMSKLTGKTFVRVSLDDASVIEGMLFDLKNERCLSTHELFAFQNFLKAYEDAKKREKKKQDLADEMGEGTWSLK